MNSLVIINRGLIKLGVPPIASLSDVSAQALAASSIYDEVRKTELATFPWSFALREAVLPEIVVPEDSKRWTEFAHTYQLPTDVVRVLGLTDYSSFQLTGDQLHTDSENVHLIYIANVDEQTWPEYFQKIVAFEFAASVAISLTDDAKRAEIMYNQAFMARRTARSIDSQQTPHVVLQLIKIYAKPSYNILTSG